MDEHVHLTRVAFLLQGGTEWGMPEVVAGLPDGSGITSIAAGARASAAVTADGRLWMWGRLMAANNARCDGRDIKEKQTSYQINYPCHITKL